MNTGNYFNFKDKIILSLKHKTFCVRYDCTFILISLQAAFMKCKHFFLVQIHTCKGKNSHGLSVNNPQWNLENKCLKQWHGGCHGILVYGQLFTHIFCKSFFILPVIKSVKHHIKAQVYRSWRWSKTLEIQHYSCHKQKEYTKRSQSLPSRTLIKHSVWW